MLRRISTPETVGLIIEVEKYCWRQEKASRFTTLIVRARCGSAIHTCPDWARGFRPYQRIAITIAARASRL
jgi:hypothetical protein